MSNRPGGGEDYLDKALDKVEQMAGRKVNIQESNVYHSDIIAAR